MAISWSEVKASQGYQSLSDEDKSGAKEQYWKDVVSVSDQFGELENSDKISAKQQFMTEDVHKVKDRGTLGNIAEASVVGPGKEIARGFAKGVSSFYGMLDTVANLTDTLSGQERTTNLFKNWSEQTARDAEAVPESDIPEWSKVIFETVGRTPPILTEFALAPGGEGAKFALTGAIQEYRESENKLDPTSLLTGGIKGAIVGTLAGPVINRGIELLRTVGRGAAKKYIAFVTGSKELADDFVKNINKYKIGSQKGIKSLKDIKIENDAKRTALKNEIKSDINIVKTKNLRQEQILDSQMKDTVFKHKEANTATKQALDNNNAEAIEAATNKSVQTIKESTGVLNAKATNVMDGALSEYKVVKKRLGENVGNAVKEASNQAPGATISHSTVMNKVNKTLEQSPFKSTSGYFKPKEFKPNTSISADNTDVTGLNNLMKELSAYKKEGFPIKYLQDLKNAARDQAGKAYKAGNNQLGKMYSDLAKDVNPATIIESSEALSSKFPNIAEANKQFSSMIKKYDTAMDMYFTKNALGEYVPDVNKALNKIATGDTVAVRQMKAADRLLPKESRIYPKVESLIKDAERVAVEHKATIKSLKKRFKAGKDSLNKTQKQDIHNLSKKQTSIKQERKISLAENAKILDEKKSAVYDSVDKQLTKLEKFYEAQEALNSATAHSGGAGILQHLFGFGGILPLFTGNFSGRNVGAAAGFFALSPKLASHLTKTGLKAGGAISSLVNPVIKNKNLQKVLIKRMRDNK